MTTLPAVVTIVDLTQATTLASTALFEVAQTSVTTGEVESLKASLTQIMTTAFGGLPTGGATGQLLGKASGTDYATQWNNLSNHLSANATSGLTIAGSTTLTAALTSFAGPAVLAVASTATAIPAAVIGTNSLFFGVDASGVAGFQVINLETTASFTGVLTVPFGGVGIEAYSVGDLLVATTATALVRLAAGTTGFLLQTRSTSTTPQWVGGSVLLNTILPNNVATAGDTTSLTSTYRNYLITFENIVPATSIGVTFQLQVATTGTSFISGNYVSWNSHVIGGAGANTSSTTVILLNGTLATTTLGNGTTYGLNGFVRVFNPAATTFRKYFVGQVAYLTGTTSGTGNFGYGFVSGYWDGGNDAISGIQFSMTTGNIQTGVIRIYGEA